MTAMTIIFIVVIGALIFCYSTIISDWKFLANHYKADRDKLRRERNWLACEIASRVALYTPNAKRRFKLNHPKSQEWLRAADAATKEDADDSHV